MRKNPRTPDRATNDLPQIRAGVKTNQRPEPGGARVTVTRVEEKINPEPEPGGAEGTNTGREKDKKPEPEPEPGRVKGTGAGSQVKLSTESEKVTQIDSLLDVLPEFEKETIPKRWKLSKKNDACFVCLRIGHQAEECKEPGDCGEGCRERHHPLLHQQGPRRQVRQAGAVSAAASSKPGSVLLPVQNVILQDGSRANVMFDSGSQVTLVNENMAIQKGLKILGPSNIVVKGIGNAESQPKHIFEIKIWTAHGELVSLPVHGIPDLKLKTKQPEIKQIAKKFPLRPPQNISAANGEIMILVGMDLASLMPVEVECKDNLVLMRGKLNDSQPLIIAGEWGGNEGSKKKVVLTCRVGNLVASEFLTPESFGVDIPRRCRSCANCSECKFKTVSLTADRKSVV